MDIYINGIGLISPQNTRNNNSFLEEVKLAEGDFFLIEEPPYKEYIAPKELRRMSKIIRNGIVSAKIALEEGGVEQPDAILTGTGLGCAIDTEKFLISMKENEERLLTPTSFIQSTHNTLGGSIAIGLGCHNYNMTYVHRGFSFESALLDAQLMMQGNEIKNALVGGFDEMTEMHAKLLLTTPQYHPTTGAFPGQGSAFFMLNTEKTDASYARFIDTEMLYQPDMDDLEERMKEFIESHEIELEKTFILLGENNWNEESIVYQHIQEKFFNHSGIGHFKQLSGEYYTASSFAFWLGAQILKKQHIPSSVIAKGESPKEIEHVLIYNQFNRTQHALILLGRC